MRNRVSLAALCVALALACPARATVTSTASSASYTCTGTVTAYTIPFPYLAASQIVAVETDASGVATTVIGTVKPSIAPTSGTLTLPSACPSGSTLSITRSVALTQPQSFRTGSYSGAAHEQAFDRLEMQVQQNAATHATDKTAQAAKDAAQDLSIAAVNGNVSALNSGSHAVTDASSVLAFGSTTPRTLTVRFADTANVKDFGATGDGVTDDTAALDAASASTAASGKTLHVPIGLYLRTTPWALKIGQRVIGENRYGNSHVRGATGDATNFQCDGASASVIRNTVGGNVIDVADVSAVPRDFELANLCIEGPATDTLGHTVGAGHGIYIHANVNPSGINLHDLWVVAVGGKGIYVTTEFTTNITNVDVHDSGDNAFELQGGNTTLLVRDYAHWVGVYSAAAPPLTPTGFRIHGGTPTLISVNGVDSAHQWWGIFGDTVAQDGVAQTSFPSLIGCNVEESGIWLKAGSTVHLRSDKFSTSVTANVTAIQADSPPGGLEIDNSNLFQTGGTGTWANGSPAHTLTDGSFYAKGTVSGWNEGATLGHRYWDGSALQTAASIQVARNAAVGPTTTTYQGGLRIAGLLYSSMYGSTVLGGGTGFTPNAGLQDLIDDSVSDGVAFTVGAPTNPTQGQRITICLRNTSGGAMGAVTWNAAYKMAAWTNPANGFGRCIQFFYNGTNWKQLFQSAADIPN